MGGRDSLVIAVLLLAFGLAADAFAVAVAAGVTARDNPPPAMRIALAFGVSQGLMPLIGYGLALATGEWFRTVDHWIAFGLLAFLGTRMIRAGWDGQGEESSFDTGSFTGLGVAALATSVDAAAAGLTLPLLVAPIWISCLVIGSTTAMLSGAGATFGRRLGLKFGARAEIAGGLVLMAIGARILSSHLPG
jgi:manganese efflux pump family protein